MIKKVIRKRFVALVEKKKNAISYVSKKIKIPFNVVNVEESEVLNKNINKAYKDITIDLCCEDKQFYKFS